MTQELYGLQAHEVTVRLVQMGTQLTAAGMTLPKGPGANGPITVHGVSYYASWRGLNGSRGFTEGSINPRLYEEGVASLSFPNSEGEDGLLHRLRFLILQAGRPTPAGGSVTTYAGGAFRPGDEFLEIYRAQSPGSPGQLLMVIAVTKATVTSGTITLEGADALWLMKKQRETAAGVYVNAPRDVIEHYTKAWRVVAADDFPQDGRFTGATTDAVTSDGLWVFKNAYNVPPTTAPTSTWGVSLGTAVRLQPGSTSGSDAVITTQGSVQCAPVSTTDPLVRFEARVRLAPSAQCELNLAAGTGVAQVSLYRGIILRLQAGSSWDGPAGTVTLETHVYETSLNDTAGTGTITLFGQTRFALTSFTAAAWHTLAVEVRDRYIFGYVDGKLCGVLENPGVAGFWDYTNGGYQQYDPPAGSGYRAQVRSAMKVWATQVGGNSPTTPGGVVDVDYVLLRQAPATLLAPASASNLGSYNLGGAPVAGGANIEVWHWDDNPPAGTEFSPGRLSQYTGRIATAGLAFPGSTVALTAPLWWPATAGVYQNTAWAARVTGSAYLTLGTYDYRFRVNCDDGARLWVGKTRSGEQLLDNWRTGYGWPGGHGSLWFYSPYLKASSIAQTTVSITRAPRSGTSTTLASTPSGWAPGQLFQVGSSQPEYGSIFSLASNVLTSTVNVNQRNYAVGDVVTILNQGSLAGQPNGWYPFIFEFFNGSTVAPGTGGATLQYERSDQPGWWVTVGAPGYIHYMYTLLNGVGGAYYWPMTEGLWEPTAVGSAQYQEYVNGAVATTINTSGTPDQFIACATQTMTPGETAPLLNGGIASGRTGDYISLGNVPIPSGALSIGCIFRCDAASSNHQEMLRKEGCILLRINTGGYLEGYAGDGTNFTTAFTTTFQPVVGLWYHVVMSYSPGSVQVFVNGAAVTVSTNPTYSGGFGTNNNPLYCGCTTANSEWFNGAVYHAFIMPSALATIPAQSLFQAVSSAPHMPASQSGIIDTTQQPLRYVSHYDQLLQTVKDWGLQIKTEPMQLESGEFPGRLRPMTRVGRDTEYTVGSPQVRRPTASDLSDAITAEEVADALIADAQGLADPGGAAQVSAEVFNFANLMGAIGGATSVPAHPWISSEYDQSNDIAFPSLLLQRLTSQLALRGAPWEHVSMSHRHERLMVDTFPLTGSIADFFWNPGDGVRLNLPELGVVDASPRQVLGVTFPITPGGLGAPSLSFRQRPRNFKQVLRDMLRNQLTAQRSYQSQLAIANGNTAGSGMDPYSRVALPSNMANLVSATLVVHVCTGSSWKIEVNDRSTTWSQISTVGRFDVTQYMQQIAGAPRGYARMVQGSGTVTYELELVIRL